MAYQKILQLSYVDKLLNDIQMEFRNKYKDDLQQGKLTRNFDFSDNFTAILKANETASKTESMAPRYVLDNNFRKSRSVIIVSYSPTLRYISHF